MQTVQADPSPPRAPVRPTAQPRVSRRPRVARNLVALAGLRPEDVERVRAVLGTSPVEICEHPDYAGAREAIDIARPMSLIVDPTTHVGLELCLDATLCSRASNLAMLGLVDDPSGRETTDAFALGLDDILPRRDLEAATIKIRALLDGDPAALTQRVPRVLVADPNRRRRARFAGQVRHMGMRVDFALDHTEVRYDPAIRLVIASAWLPSLGALACLRQFRRDPVAAGVPWVFIGTSAEIERLAAALVGEPGIAFHRVDRDAGQLTSIASELLQPRTGTRRRSARVPLETPVCFRVEPDGPQVWGCSTDLSMDGLFVRTLTAPPVGSSVRVSFCLSAQPPIVLDALVIRRVELSRAAPSDPGFAVQFAGPIDPAVLERLTEGYRQLLAATAAARVAGRRGMPMSWPLASP